MYIYIYMYICIHICMCVCIYIYIYIYIYSVLHTRIRKQEHPSDNATEIHWTIPVIIHWTSQHPLEHTTDKKHFVGKCRWKSIGEHATENPRCFLRCWFLVCKMCNMMIIIIIIIIIITCVSIIILLLLLWLLLLLLLLLLLPLEEQLGLPDSFLMTKAKMKALYYAIM